jgi:hypothetical protein
VIFYLVAHHVSAGFEPCCADDMETPTDGGLHGPDGMTGGAAAGCG